jgi:MFS family permease
MRIGISAGTVQGARDSRQGWAVVVAATAGVALGLGPIPFYTIGIFAPELSRAFGWSFATLMGSIAVQSAVVMVSSPLVGLALDRFGARLVALISMLLFGLCFMSLALSNGSLTLYYSQWVVMSLVGTGTLAATWTRVVAGWFDRHRGLALGLASTGSGITGFLIKPLTAWLITDFGWRTAFVVIGALPILIGMPLVAWLLRENRTGAPAISADAPAAAAAPADGEQGLRLVEALHHPRFWIMAGAFLLISFSLTAPTPNLENILRSARFDLAGAAKVAASFGLAVIAGRIIGGWLLDRLWAPACAAVILSLPAIGCWLLAGSVLDPTTALVAVVFLGLGVGFEFDLLAFLISRYFGQRHYGAIYGSFYTVIACGGGLGPVVYGYTFDSTGSYHLILRVGVGCLIVGAGLLLLLGAYPDWNRTRSGSDADAHDPGHATV